MGNYTQPKKVSEAGLKASNIQEIFKWCVGLYYHIVEKTLLLDSVTLVTTRLVYFYRKLGLHVIKL